MIIGNEIYKNLFLGIKGIYYGTFNSATCISLSTIKHYDLIVFTGGSDIDPKMYGEDPHITTKPNIHRDIGEAKVYYSALEAGVPMLGICRGAQLLTVLNGGSLIQNINKHSDDSGHIIETKLPSNSIGSKTMLFNVSSTHHQMMYPWVLPLEAYSVLGWAKGLSDKYDGVPEYEIERGIYDNKKIASMRTKGNYVLEPEIIYFKGSNSLAVQYHPEIMSPDSAGFKYFQDILRYYLIGNKEIASG
jgi:GMP synthase-like glutamine amidotransferase